MKTRTLLTALAAPALFAASAQAQSSSLEDAPLPLGTPALAEKPPTEVVRYGWQIVLADIAGVVAGVAATNATDQPAFMLAYPLASPAVHAAHGNAPSAVMSLGLHVLAPVAGAYAGYHIESANCSPGEWFCGLGGLALGTLAGAVTATVVDATFLAKMERPVKRPSSIPMPTVAVARGGGVIVGLAGRL